MLNHFIPVSDTHKDKMESTSQMYVIKRNGN